MNAEEEPFEIVGSINYDIATDYEHSKVARCPTDPWAHFLHARVLAIHHYTELGMNPHEIADTLNLDSAEHVLAIYEATT